MKFIPSAGKQQAKIANKEIVSQPKVASVTFKPSSSTPIATNRVGSIYMQLSDGGYGRRFMKGQSKIFETITKEDYAAKQ